MPNSRQTKTVAYGENTKKEDGMLRLIHIEHHEECQNCQKLAVVNEGPFHVESVDGNTFIIISADSTEYCVSHERI